MRCGRVGDPQLGQMFTRGAEIECWARRLSRRAFDVFFLGTAMRTAEYSQALATPREPGVGAPLRGSSREREPAVALAAAGAAPAGEPPATCRNGSEREDRSEGERSRAEARARESGRRADHPPCAADRYANGNLDADEGGSRRGGLDE